MSEYISYEPFSVCFNMLKMRYRDYDEDLTRLGFLEPHDKINVFINIETILKYLSSIQDVENKLMLQRDYPVLLTSCFLNLVAHYKAFFIKNGLDTKVYLFGTDLSSNSFPQERYNSDFRSYYMIKYTDNPKYIYLTEGLTKNVIPEVRTIIDYIPNAYFVTSKNIDGSVIPMVIANDDLSRKNLVIGGELFDTQFSLIDRFVNHCIRRGPNLCSITSTIGGYLSCITKKPEEELTDMIKLCENYSIYVGLLSVLGDKSRSIEGIPGIGPMKYTKMVSQAVSDMKINSDSVTPEILSNVFRTASNDYDDKFAQQFINNFHTLSVKDMYNEITGAEKQSILSQITDHVDITGLGELNKSKFFNHPLILESLSL